MQQARPLTERSCIFNPRMPGEIIMTAFWIKIIETKKSVFEIIFVNCTYIYYNMF